MSKKNRIVVPCRFAYFNCWRPTSQYGGEDKYSLSLLIPKGDEATINEINEAIEKVKSESVQKWGGRIPNNLKLPIHDGDDEKPENSVFQNCFYINAKSKIQPQIVDSNVKPILDQTEVYSGCYGNVSLVFYGYSFGGSRGVGVLLGNIQKVRDGTPLNGRVLASQEFHIVNEDGVEK